jgi:hypothetical protein
MAMNTPTSYRNRRGDRANQKLCSKRLIELGKITLFPIDANGPNGTGGVCGRGQSERQPGGLARLSRDAGDC